MKKQSKKLSKSLWMALIATLKWLNVLSHIPDWYYEREADRKYEGKIRETEKLAERTGKTHWLIVAGDGLAIVNRETIKHHNRENRKSKISSWGLDNKSLYKVDGKGLKRDVEIKTKK